MFCSELYKKKKVSKCIDKEDKFLEGLQLQYSKKNPIKIESNNEDNFHLFKAKLSKNDFVNYEVKSKSSKQDALENKLNNANSFCLFREESPEIYPARGKVKLSQKSLIKIVSDNEDSFCFSKNKLSKDNLIEYKVKPKLFQASPIKIEFSDKRGNISL